MTRTMSDYAGMVLVTAHVPVQESRPPRGADVACQRSACGTAAYLCRPARTASPVHIGMPDFSHAGTFHETKLHYRGTKNQIVHLPLGSSPKLRELLIFRCLIPNKILSEAEKWNVQAQWNVWYSFYRRLTRILQLAVRLVSR